MKRYTIIPVILALLLVLVWAVAHNYWSRPFFAGDFRLFDWEHNKLVAVGTRIVFIDRREHVLLVVPVLPDGNVEWIPEPTTVGTVLFIRQAESGLVRQVAWRRNCVIYISGDGQPRYVDVESKSIDAALSSPSSEIAQIRRIVER